MKHHKAAGHDLEISSDVLLRVALLLLQPWSGHIEIRHSIFKFACNTCRLIKVRITTEYWVLSMHVQRLQLDQHADTWQTSLTLAELSSLPIPVLSIIAYIFYGTRYCDTRRHTQGFDMTAEHTCCAACQEQMWHSQFQGQLSGPHEHSHTQHRTRC